MRFERRVARERHSYFRRGMKAAMIFFEIIADTATYLRKKKGKKREERGIISKIVGTTIVSRSGIFFIVFRSNFENGDDEAEEK